MSWLTRSLPKVVILLTAAAGVLILFGYEIQDSPTTTKSWQSSKRSPDEAVQTIEVRGHKSTPSTSSPDTASVSKSDVLLPTQSKHDQTVVKTTEISDTESVPSPSSPDTASVRESTVFPPTQSHLTDSEVNLDHPQLQQLPSKQTPAKPTFATGESAAPVPGVVPIPSILPAHIKPCKNDTMCKVNLQSDIDLNRWQFCADKYDQAGMDTPIRTCRFMNGTYRYPVGLISFPGSGYTWVRGLLEEATGICTGSIYCDVDLRASGMIGEYLRTGSVLVVKTHVSRGHGWATRDTSDFRGFSSAILLVRNPLDALVSEWNRLHTDHQGAVGPKFFGNRQDWNGFVVHCAKQWKEYFTSLILSGSGHPVLLVRYEDIKNDIVREVKRMLDFLKFPYKESELVERLATDFSEFHRASLPTFDHYTASQRETVRATVQATVQLLKRNHHSCAAQIEKYL